jgi:hypothetical protein
VQESAYTESMRIGFSSRLKHISLSALLAAGLLLSGPAGFAQEAGSFDAGVRAYRDGDYQNAQKTFDLLHRLHPEDSRVTYYLAITEAQLGRFKQARALYERILLLDPHSEVAQLAAEGLQYLPGENTLDHPPRFQGGRNQPAQGRAVNPSPAVPGGLNPQDLMMWQMMMGLGGNNQGGMNPMTMMMMPGMAGNGENGMSQMDPGVMSNMMMNQMMQNFSLFGDQDRDR